MMSLRQADSVLLVSDLDYGGASGAMSRHLLWDFVSGSLGDSGAAVGSAKIARVILAGGLITKLPVRVGSKFLTSEEQVRLLGL